MYFIRVKPVKEQLRERAMTDRECLPYYVVPAACISLVLHLPMAALPTTRWDLFSGITDMLLTIAGILYCYRQNGGKTGYDFIQKSVVLGWVVGIRFSVIMIPVVVGLEFLKTGIGQSMEQTSWVDVLGMAILLVIYFQRLGKHLKDTILAQNDL